MKSFTQYINEDNTDVLKKYWIKLYNKENITEEEINNTKFLVDYIVPGDQAMFLLNKGTNDHGCPVNDMKDIFKEYGEVLNTKLKKWTNKDNGYNQNELKNVISRISDLKAKTNKLSTLLKLNPSLTTVTDNQKELFLKLKNFIMTVLCYNVGVNQEECNSAARDAVGITKFLQVQGYSDFKLKVEQKSQYTYYIVSIQVPAGGELPSTTLQVVFRIKFGRIKLEN